MKQRSKKIIFVAGTSRSGSTILDTILSNDKKGLSLGEIHAIFRPYKKNHVLERENLKKRDKRWEKIIKDGENKLFPNLISLFDEYDYFVDSSKDPLWILKHQKLLKKQKIGYSHILIYKDPFEIGDSFYKRNLRWKNQWINYHRRYFSLIKPDIILQYKDFILNKGTLKKVFEILQLDYDDNKRNYSSDTSGTIFGSNSVKSLKTLLYKEISNDIVERVNQDLKDQRIMQVWNYLLEYTSSKSNKTIRKGRIYIILYKIYRYLNTKRLFMVDSIRNG